MGMARTSKLIRHSNLVGSILWKKQVLSASGLSGPPNLFPSWIPSSATQLPQHGVIASVDEIAKIQSYLNTPTSEVAHDKEKKQTVVKGHGEIVVSLVELTHEAN